MVFLVEVGVGYHYKVTGALVLKVRQGQAKAPADVIDAAAVVVLLHHLRRVGEPEEMGLIGLAPS